MKTFSKELYNKINTKKASLDLLLAILAEVDPNELCVSDFYEGSQYNPDKCCILGLISFLRTGNAMPNWNDDDIEDFREDLTTKIKIGGQCLAHVNNGSHPRYKQKTVYKRLNAFANDLQTFEIHEQLRVLGGIHEYRDLEDLEERNKAEIID